MRFIVCNSAHLGGINNKQQKSRSLINAFVARSTDYQPHNAIKQQSQSVAILIMLLNLSMVTHSKCKKTQTKEAISVNTFLI